MSHDALVGWAWAPGVGRTPAPGTQAELAALLKHGWRPARRARRARNPFEIIVRVAYNGPSEAWTRGMNARPSGVFSRVVATFVAWSLPCCAMAQSAAPPRAGSLGDFFLEYLLWLLPVLALIGWFRAWVFALIPIGYVVYVQALIWPKFTPTGYGDRLLLAMFAGYALACLLVTAVAAAIGNKRPPPPCAGIARRACGLLQRRASLRRLDAHRRRRARRDRPAAALLGPARRRIRHHDGCVPLSFAPARRRDNRLRRGDATAAAPGPITRGHRARQRPVRRGGHGIMVEGLICAVIVIPLFCRLGAPRRAGHGRHLPDDRWPRPAIYSFAVLPLVIGFVEAGVPLPERSRRSSAPC